MTNKIIYINQNLLIIKRILTLKGVKMSDSLLSNRFQSLMEEIYEDGKVSPIELSNLRKQIAKEQQNVLENFPQSRELKSLCDNYNSVVENTQSLILSLRNRRDGIDDDISDLGIAKVYALLQAQNRLIEANLQVFSSALQAKRK